MTNSRAKGARGERELRDWLRARGHDARRGQQFAGGTDSPDVVSDLDDVMHIEVKRVERLLLEAAIQQSLRDSSESQISTVWWKKNRGNWVVCLPADHFMRVLEAALSTLRKPGNDSSENHDNDYGTLPREAP